MIAEELHKFIRNDVRKAVTEMATAETEEYLNAKQAAVFLGWKLQILYNRIHDIPHTKNGKSLIFTKSGFEKIHGKKIIPDGFGRLSGN
ncbi:DNA-binding protein [Bacteroides thetaiotaomicron]|nr:DNA-binding protein [Bacteroides thetaiotaomicron]